MTNNDNDDTGGVRNLPCPRVLLRSKQRLEVFTIIGNDDNNERSRRRITLLRNCTTTIQALLPDGSAVFVHVPNVGIVKCSLLPEEGEETAPPTAFLKGGDTKNVQMMDISPLGNYLLTWERYYVDKCPENLKVWSATTGQLLTSFMQKNLSKESWPYWQWSIDEQYGFLLCNNTQIRVYRGTDIINNNNNKDGGQETAPSPPLRFIDKLQVPCSTLSLPQQAPAPPTLSGTSTSMPYNYFFTTFSSKTKDKPATVAVYQYQPDSSNATTRFVRKATKSLFQAEECVTHWSPDPINKPACLLTLQTSVDATGQSYYGNSQLWLWNTEQKQEADTILAVPLPQDGPVQHVSWLPNPDKPNSFLAIAGRMPAMASQHHGITGNVTFLFGNNVHRNTVAASPHARFVCLGGFGNLAGGMGFWDMNKKKLIPHCPVNLSGNLRAEATVTMHSWSPDSRYFLVATTAPRMNVDNGAVLYKYTGQQVVEDNVVPWNNDDYKPNLLLEACFVPALWGVYPDRPQSPVPERQTDGGEAPETTTTAAAAAPVASADTAAPKPAGGKYVPPSHRNRAGGRGSAGGGSSLAERMRREKEGNVVGATKITKSTPNVAGRVGGVVGMAAGPASGKTKSQLKREKQKKKQEQQKAAALETAAAEPEPAAAATEAAPQQQQDPEKRARKLKKTLKQIEDLKNKPDLNDDQKAKIATEGSVRKELEELGL